ncbi:MAG TPA: orotidine-5'-phosphate decarboxylase [Gemmatimonadaceae bacterium]|nr:orotidine-5'-phosphate decarboxylase [Gemmatimonadaceae bacterium]
MNRPTPIVALDVSTDAQASALVDELGDLCRFYKVGNELFTAAGPAVVEMLRARGAQVFLDLKFHDIPNTVAGAVRSAAALGARLVTVHASGGMAMLRAAVDAAGNPERCGVLAVTVLTSLDAAALREAWGRSPEPSVDEEVLRLGALARSAGVFGLVCSGHEVRPARERFGMSLALLVPGVRLFGTGQQDQARVVTPRAAAEAGATYVVLGRTVTAAADRRGAMEQVLAALA